MIDNPAFYLLAGAIGMFIGVAFQDYRWKKEIFRKIKDGTIQYAKEANSQ